MGMGWDGMGRDRARWGVVAGEGMELGGKGREGGGMDVRGRRWDGRRGS